jgi:hypothetical protein
MQTVAHTDETAKLMVKRFCNHVFWLRVVRHDFKELFENEKSKILMERTAPSFFGGLNRILHSYLLLEFVKITDPKTISGRKQEPENFTVDNLIESIVWPHDVLEKLRLLGDKAKAFRKRILYVRNKLLAHIDKEAFLTDTILGEFPEGEDEVFLKTLQEVCDITHKVCFGSIFGEMVMARPGDVLNFKRALAKAVAFDELLSESMGQEKAKLFSYLQKIIPKTSLNNGTSGGLKT